MTEKLRKVKLIDSEILFKWRNHPVVRRTSFDKNEILLTDHEEWYRKILKKDSVIMYLLEIDSVPVGTVRFDIEEGDTAKINYLIDPAHHGKGHGSKLLEIGIEKISKENKQLKKVYGLVLKENVASIKIFKKIFFNRVFENGSELKFEKLIK